MLPIAAILRYVFRNEEVDTLNKISIFSWIFASLMLLAFFIPSEFQNKTLLIAYQILSIFAGPILVVFGTAALITFVRSMMLRIRTGKWNLLFLINTIIIFGSLIVSSVILNSLI